jgi:hypothetical protein
MTNIPTLGAFVAFLSLMTFLPLITGFVFSYVFFRSMKTSFFGGLSSILAFFLLLRIPFPFLINALLAGFFSCILIGIILYKTKNWNPATIRTNVIDALNIFNRKNLTVVFIAAILIASIVVYGLNKEKELEFNIIDPKDDISYQGWTKSELSGYDHIDIIRMESRIVDDSVVLEMELAGNVSEKETVDYDFFIYTTRYSAPDSSISKRDMEKEGNILRGYIPVKSLESRKIFVINAVASESDFNSSIGIDGISDKSSKKRALGGYLQSSEYLLKLLLTPR